jgi:tripartite-type tricarboxylate transporter receptor subunit TctC
VTPSLPVKTVREFIALARARPNEIVFASSGAGSNTHLALELFRGETKIRVTHVPYKGAGPAVTDVMAGHAQAMVADLPVLVSHLRSGKLRALAITGLERTTLFPDIPSMKELGYPQVNSRNWYALLAPAKTPPEIINRLNEAVRQAVAMPDLRDQLVALGADIYTLSPEEFGKYLQSEIARWKGVVAKYKLAPDL